MARARSFGNVAACCASSKHARYRIFREISCSSPLNAGTFWYQCCVRHFTPKCFTLLRCKWVPGGREMAIVVGQVTSATWLQCCMLPGELKWYMDEQVQWPGIIWCKAPWAALGWICAPYKYSNYYYIIINVTDSNQPIGDLINRGQVLGVLSS